jgi:hypothetical protein
MAHEGCLFWSGEQDCVATVRAKARGWDVQSKDVSRWCHCIFLHAMIYILQGGSSGVLGSSRDMYRINVQVGSYFRVFSHVP